MKPTKSNLKEEIEHRLSLLEDVMKGELDVLVYNIVANEHSILTEFNQLIEIFGKKIGYRVFKQSNYTPIVCYRTGEPLLIGDKVETIDHRCGILVFREWNNQYAIETGTGGFIHAKQFIKIHELYDYKIDVGRVECRNKNRILKRRW